MNTQIQIYRGSLPQVLEHDLQFARVCSIQYSADHPNHHLFQDRGGKYPFNNEKEAQKQAFKDAEGPRFYRTVLDEAILKMAEEVGKDQASGIELITDVNVVRKEPYYKKIKDQTGDPNRDQIPNEDNGIYVGNLVIWLEAIGHKRRNP